MGGEGGISIIKGDGEVEIGGEFGVSGEELGSDFAVAGDDELGVGIDGFVRNFVVKVAAELLSRFGGVVSGLSVVGFGSAGEEEIWVGDGDIDRVLLEVGEGGLEGNGEDDGAFVVALAEEVDAVAVKSADVVGEVTPEAGEFVAVETADFDGTLGGDVGDTGGGSV